MQTAKTPTPPPSLGRLATIGSHQPEAWQIVTRMVREQGWHLVDIRSQPSSFLAEWSAQSLRWHFGYSYHTVPEFGNLHELDYDQPVKLADPAIGLAKVGGYLEAGINCLLLCACPNWQHCHRKQVAILLHQAYPSLEVSHLIPDALAVELPVVTSKTAELFQCYGLLKTLPYGPGEQPVLLRTARCQRIMLPGLGHCVLGLSVYLWLPNDPRQPERQADQMSVGVILPGIPERSHEYE
jgi:hypothetical protein